MSNLDLNIARERIEELEAKQATQFLDFKQAITDCCLANERIAELDNDLEMAHGCTVHEELICVSSQI